MKRSGRPQVFCASFVVLALGCSGSGARSGSSAHPQPGTPPAVARAPEVRELGTPAPCPRAPLRLDDGQTAYYACQLREPAQVAPAQAVPHYPEILRSSDMDGEVAARFVVDTAGRAHVSSLRVATSTHALFTQAVRQALPNMRWAPARHRGRATAQVVERTFRFRLVPDSVTPCPAVTAPERESVVCRVVLVTPMQCSHGPCPQRPRRRPAEPPTPAPSLPNEALQLTWELRTASAPPRHR